MSFAEKALSYYSCPVLNVFTFEPNLVTFYSIAAIISTSNLLAASKACDLDARWFEKNKINDVHKRVQGAPGFNEVPRFFVTTVLQGRRLIRSFFTELLETGTRRKTSTKVGNKDKHTDRHDDEDVDGDKSKPISPRASIRMMIEPPLS